MTKENLKKQTTTDKHNKAITSKRQHHSTPSVKPHRAGTGLIDVLALAATTKTTTDVRKKDNREVIE